MATYYIPTTSGNRIYESSLKDAYADAAKTLLYVYKATNGNIHKLIKEYTPSYGIPIYSSRTGKTYTHWVRFDNGSNPKNGYEECSYDKRIGVISRGKSFPKSW